MVQDEDLKKLEKQVYTKFFQDGLTDILLGIIFIGMGVSGFFRDYLIIPLNYVPGIAVFCVGFSIYYLGKKKITIPRLGVVKFGPIRKAAKKKLIAVDVILTIFILILLILTFLDISPLKNFANPILIGFLLYTIPLSILAHFSQFKRLYGIAILAGTSELLIALFSLSLDLNSAINLTNYLIGGIILFIGYIILIQFLRKYQRLDEKMMEVN